MNKSNRLMISRNGIAWPEDPVSLSPSGPVRQTEKKLAMKNKF